MRWWDKVVAVTEAPQGLGLAFGKLFAADRCETAMLSWKSIELSVISHRDKRNSSDHLWCLKAG